MSVNISIITTILNIFSSANNMMHANLTMLCTFYVKEECDIFPRNMSST